MYASHPPSFGPLVAVCKKHGIGKTKAFELAKQGVLRTFLIGSRRYVCMESLRALASSRTPGGGE